MILDQLANASLYFNLSARIAAALRHLQQTNWTAAAPGRYALDGDHLFVLVQQYETKPREQGFWEAHRKYMDVQYVHSGVEWMGYATLTHLQAGEYDPSKDFLPLHGEGEFFQLRAGTFTLLAPQDAHMPGMAHGTPQAVKKVVVKIAV